MSMIEWLNELDHERHVYCRLGRYDGPLTEAILIEAIAGVPEPRHIVASTMGAAEFLNGRKPVFQPPTTRFSEDSLVLMTPGKVLKLEVSFDLPNGFLSVG